MNNDIYHPAGLLHLNFETAIRPYGLASGAISDPSLVAFSSKPFGSAIPTEIVLQGVDMTYNAVNQMTGLSRFGDVAGLNAIAETSYSYDQNNRLTQLAHRRGAIDLATYAYTYDSADKLIQLISSIDGTTNYAYDATNQLTGADHSSQTDEAYSYDANGNRTNAGYQTGSNNQMLADGTYTYEYDKEGNRTKRTEVATGKVTEYAWDYLNRLVGVMFKDAAGAVIKNIEYLYDVNNLRIGKKIDGVVTERYVLDREQIALVFDSQSNQTQRYFYGTRVDQVLAEESGTQARWFLADHQGTVRDVVDGSGAIVDHITYDSFGQILTQTSNIDLRFAYTGRELDEETGQYYYRARYYDEAVGRFISEDLIGFSAGDANLNRYVGNSPTLAIDPSGMFQETTTPPTNWLQQAGKGIVNGARAVGAGAAAVVQGVSTAAVATAGVLLVVGEGIIFTRPAGRGSDLVPRKPQNVPTPYGPPSPTRTRVPSPAPTPIPIPEKERPQKPTLNPRPVRRPAPKPSPIPVPIPNPNCSPNPEEEKKKKTCNNYSGPNVD